MRIPEALRAGTASRGYDSIRAATCHSTLTISRFTVMTPLPLNEAPDETLLAPLIN
jgi:hypothetical protein